MAANRFLVCDEPAAERRLHAEGREEIRRHAEALHPLRVPHAPIRISTGSAALVDLSRRESFHTRDKLIKGVALERAHDPMNMRAHDDCGEYAATIAVKMQQSVFYQASHTRIA